MTRPDKSNRLTGVSAWRLPTPPELQSTLARWIVHSPRSHPFWAYWLVGLVHLRDVDGHEPASKQYREATLELCVFALDPSVEVDLSGRSLRLLQPVDVHEQFH